MLFGENIVSIGLARHMFDVAKTGLLGISDCYLTNVEVSQFLWDGTCQ